MGGNVNLSIADNVIVAGQGYAISNNYVSWLTNNLISGPLGAIGRGCNGWGPPAIQLGNNGNTGTHCPDTGQQLRFNIGDPVPGAASNYTRTVNFNYLPANTCEDIEFTDFASLNIANYVFPAVTYATATGTVARTKDATTFASFIKNSSTIVLRRCNHSSRVPASKISNVSVNFSVKP